MEGIIVNVTEIKVKKLAKNIFYITGAITNHKKIAEAFENDQSSDSLSKIIPREWKKWVHGNPETVKNEDGSVEITAFKTRNDDEADAGWQKFIDWDYFIAGNRDWPKEEVNETYDKSHVEAFEILKNIDKPYKESLKIWSDFSGIPFSQKLISKNYTIKKYKAGGGVGEHVDRNIDNKKETMDWTALIYLTDGYSGGEVCFLDSNLEIVPEAGSILIFPTDILHSAKPVESGTKMFIFMYLHTKYGISNSINEDVYPTIEAMIRSGDVTD